MTTTTQDLVYINEPVIESVDDPLTNFQPNANELTGGDGAVIYHDPNELTGGDDTVINHDPNEVTGAEGTPTNRDMNLVSNWTTTEPDPAKNNILEGGEGNDTLTGIGEGYGRFNGYEGDDILKGGPVFNILVGGEGYDQITGGSGNNFYLLTEGHGFDTITNFTKGKDAISHPYSEEIDITDLTVVNQHISGNALIFYGDDLLAIVTGAAGMLENGTWYSGNNVLM